MEIDDLILEYSTSATINLKAQVTPSTGNCTRVVNRSVNKSKLFSPCASTTPKYSDRKGKGDVVCSFNAAKWGISRISNRSEICIKTLVPDEAVMSDYPYMYQLPYDVMMTLSRRLDFMGSVVMDSIQKEEVEWSSVDILEGTESIQIYGQICCLDDGGKLESNQILLQSSWSNSAGKVVEIDVSSVENFSFFPGQFVALSGLNPSGKLFVVEKLLPLSLPQKSPCPDLNQQISVICAAGPFTTSENLDFKPLDDLINEVIDRQPDILILIGPFIPAKHLYVEKNLVSFTFEKIFELLILTHICEPLKGIRTKVVIVSSPKDIFHDPIYPCPAYNLRKVDDRIIFVPDPCTIEINGFILSVSSTDILFHMSKGEVSNSESHRMVRLLEHLLTQRSYYPLYPANEEINIDYTNFHERTGIDICPHAMILPSNLRQFVQERHDVCFINPGYLSKGEGGGTFCRMQINPRNSAWTQDCKTSEIICVEIVKI